MHDGADRQASWECGKDGEEGQASAVMIHSTEADVDFRIEWLACDVQVQTRCDTGSEDLHLARVSQICC